jgi:hypothetical protein
MRSPALLIIKVLPSLSLALLLFGSVHAADEADTDDPPDRIARLSYLKGDVSVKPAGSDDWADAVLNRPLTTDDELNVDRNGRTELQTESITLHLDGGSAFSFLELTDNVLQARLSAGALHVTVRDLRPDEVVEIDTPHAAITVLEPGDYHIEVGARTLVKNYRGAAEVSGSGEPLRIAAREQVAVGESERELARQTTGARDEFDQWAQRRNERFARGDSSRYVANDVVGYEDLDEFGRWSNEAEYGHVWYPTYVADGWSPYRYGHWVWVRPWGWSWVDDAPWGFAPFHYGRWAHIRGHWGWVPGPLHVRAVYAPAIVGWVGNSHVSVSVGFGSGIGWYPLAPREVYVPGYRCSRRYIHNVNHSNTIIVNNTIINRVYANRDTRLERTYRKPELITAVRHDDFVNARRANNHRVRLDGRRALDDWQDHNATPRVAPDRGSALSPNWRANVPRRVQYDTPRTVVTRHKPDLRRATVLRERDAERSNSQSTRQLWNNELGRRGQPNQQATPSDAARSNSRWGARRDERRVQQPARQYDPPAGSTVQQQAPAAARSDAQNGQPRDSQPRGGGRSLREVLRNQEVQQRSAPPQNTVRQAEPRVEPQRSERRIERTERSERNNAPQNRPQQTERQESRQNGDKRAHFRSRDDK